ncbi:hypothetical protein ACOBQB_13575 [Streptomyces sp. G5(2025)]|uniref:hypothetical protein n=1 Tax=Streptomyces sp. G5(2025) TaxID=3406628 RepID=UPI003C285B09
MQIHDGEGGFGDSTPLTPARGHRDSAAEGGEYGTVFNGWNSVAAPAFMKYPPRPRASRTAVRPYMFVSADSGRLLDSPG